MDAGAAPLSVAELDRYLAYHRQVTALYQQALARQPRPGEKPAPSLAAESTKLQEARASSGLAPETIRRFEAAARDALDAWRAADDEGGRPALEELRALAARLAPAAREQFEAEARALEAKLAEAQTLAGVRARHGDGVADALLRRADELKALDSARVRALTGGSP